MKIWQIFIHRIKILFLYLDSNLVYGKIRLRYGLSIDKGDIDIIDNINDDYLAASWNQGTWALYIENNIDIDVSMNDMGDDKSL